MRHSQFHVVFVLVTSMIPVPVFAGVSIHYSDYGLGISYHSHGGYGAHYDSKYHYAKKHKRYKSPYYGKQYYKYYSPKSAYHHSYYSKSKNYSYGYDNYKSYADPWTTLASGHYRAALKAFSYEAQSYPKAGIPKVGYALSAAASGDLATGVWAMRRAFAYDPQSLQQLKHDERLHPVIYKLKAEYEYMLKGYGRNEDAAFMLAALNYFSGNRKAARYAIKDGAHYGDRSRSLKNLKLLIYGHIGHGYIK